MSTTKTATADLPRAVWATVNDLLTEAIDARQRAEQAKAGGPQVPSDVAARLTELTSIRRELWRQVGWTA